MTRKSRQKLDLNRYMKEELVVIQVRVSRSQHELLKTMAETMNQALPDLVALLLTDWVMPAVEEAVRDHEETTDQPTLSTREASTKKPNQTRAANNITGSSPRPNENGGQTEAPPQSSPSPPAAPAEPSAGRPVETLAACRRTKPDRVLGTESERF